MIFTACDLPIEDRPPPIRPKAERHQDHHLPTCALFPLPLTFFRLDLLLLPDDRDPEAMQLEHGGNISELSLMHSPGQGFNLVKPFIESSQTPLAVNCRAPAVSDLA